MAQVGAGSAGDADVPVDVVPLDAGLAEPQFLAEGVHSGDAFLQVPAGPDVAEAGHASMLRFIRTIGNRKMTPAQGAEQTGVLAAGSGRESSDPSNVRVSCGNALFLQLREGTPRGFRIGYV